MSLFRRGWVIILVAWLREEPLPPGHFQPAPWPAAVPLVALAESLPQEVLHAA